MSVDTWAALASGVAVAACCGLRAFLPLLVVGLAARHGLVELRGGLEWLAGDTALVAFGIATALEIAADKIPLVDHALDVVATVLRPVAAGVGSLAVLVEWPSPWAQLAAVVCGGMALGIHGLRASARLGSTVATSGVANPLLSLLDDLLALLLLAAAVFGSLALAAMVALIVGTRFRRRAGAAAVTMAPSAR
jgi:hypothetical protein